MARVVGLALVIRLKDAMENPGFLRGAVIRAPGVAAAAVQFLSALKSSPLWLEIPAQATGSPLTSRWFLG